MYLFKFNIKIFILTTVVQLQSHGLKCYTGTQTPEYEGQLTETNCTTTDCVKTEVEIGDQGKGVFMYCGKYLTAMVMIKKHLTLLQYRVSHITISHITIIFSASGACTEEEPSDSPQNFDSETHVTFHPTLNIDQVTAQNVRQTGF